MNDDSRLPQNVEWHPLFAAACDQQLRDEDRPRLQDLLRSDEDARREFVAYCDLHAALVWRYRDGRNSNASEPPIVAAKTRFMDRLKYRPIQFAATIVIAASLLLLVWRPWRAEPISNVAEMVAVVEQIDGELLSVSIYENSHMGGNAVVSGSKLTVGRCRLTEGAAQLQLSSGVRLTIEGPAEFELRTPMLVELIRGRIAAAVPPQAIGFTVLTPEGRIVDHGTEFGVGVKPSGETEVEVFSGRVDIASSTVHDAAMLSLLEGESRRMIAGRIETLPESATRQPWSRSLVPAGDFRELGGPTPVEPISPPFSVEQGAIDYAEHFVVFRERRSFVLDRPLELRRRPVINGRDPEVAYSVVVPAGATVDVFLVHYDSRLPPDTSSDRLARSIIRFRGKVLGVLSSAADLDATDAWLGAPETRYPSGDRETFAVNSAECFHTPEGIRPRVAGSLYLGGFRAGRNWMQLRVLVAADTP